MLFAAVTALLTGCHGHETSAYTDIPPHGWVYGDTVKMMPTDADSTLILTGDIALVVRHTNDYAYSNMYVRLEYSDPDTIQADTLNITLADPYGNWLGKGLGVSYQRADTVEWGVTIDASKPIKVSHIMRADTLKAVEQVGIIFLSQQ